LSTDLPNVPANSGMIETSRPSPLILLPGLGGDPRLFDGQRSAFPELVTPRWIEPDTNESLADYAARFATVIDPGRPCFLGGVSFGGVVALEVASHLKTRECYLLGSIRSPKQMPNRLKILSSIASLIIIPKRLSPWVLTCGGRWLNPMVRGALHQLKDSDETFLRWAAGAILKWTPSAGVERVRVVQIHGDRDRVFPIGQVSADKTIARAGHLVSLTHGKEVNQFLRERMSHAPDCD
jgi:pimeloyl-ACP methyl ester carboxylesterase